jgi:hypothetical protein
MKKLEEYLNKSGRDDSKTLCVCIETENTWSAGELRRYELQSYRDEFQSILAAFLAENDPELHRRPGETVEDVISDGVGSYLYDMHKRGKWTRDEPETMVGIAFNFAERAMAELHLTPEMIQAVHIKMRSDGVEFVISPGFVLRPSATVPDLPDTYELRDGQHRIGRMVAPRSIIH